MGVTYDAGALIAAEALRLDVWAAHRAENKQTRLTVPAPVLAQAWRAPAPGPVSLVAEVRK